jgi:hypothetical protein
MSTTAMPNFEAFAPWGSGAWAEAGDDRKPIDIAAAAAVANKSVLTSALLAVSGRP